MKVFGVLKFIDIMAMRVILLPIIIVVNLIYCIKRNVSIKYQLRCECKYIRRLWWNCTGDEEALMNDYRDYLERVSKISIGR